MEDQRTLQTKRVGGTSGGARSASLRGLPSDLLQEGARRLGWIGLVYATGFLVIFFVPRLSIRVTLPDLIFRPQGIIVLVSVLAGIGVFYLARRTTLPAHRVLDLGLGFEVLGALGIAMSEFWGAFPVWSEDVLLESFLGIPWECVWIIGFPLVAPNTPRKTLVASLAAASAGPVTILLSMAFGEPAPAAPPFVVAGYFLFTTYVCALVAYFASRNFVRYGVRLQKAREIGNYVLVDRLGEGGMGEVWAARHRMLARPAAVKLIRGDLLGSSASSRETALIRFEREARATAALTSPHTVIVYDFGVSDDGAFFYVMELLNGLSLQTLVERFGPLKPARAVHLLKQVCDSLAEAHESGLVHRDIKPGNILNCRVGLECDFVKVLDFGLVKPSRVPAESAPVTGDVVAGTPGYMAPEQALQASDVDPRTDIYALGCVAYWLLTGEMVFHGDSPVGTIFQHVRDTPDPPSTRSELNIPSELDRIVMDCLEKDREARPASASELARRLESVPVADWDRERAWEWWSLNLPEHVSGDHGLPPELRPAEVLRVLR